MPWQAILETYALFQDIINIQESVLIRRREPLGTESEAENSVKNEDKDKEINSI